jgi:hypothetical protein
MGCAVARNAVWHDPMAVNSIMVTQRHGISFEVVKTIDNSDKIEELVAYMNRLQQGWKEIFITEPTGEIRVAFSENIDENKFYTVALCPRDKGGALVMDVDGKHCSREITQKEKEEFLALLEMDHPEIVR